ncbi:unnamed protein product [Lactuca virosa]|uniref:Uncharacterized protein n=1 Tax=Lactuca virosa TaxID=75947 RepID=A0AAU9MFN4_9ASTR|nr:unnamed protein product [Lactuca virosa]
MKHEVVDDFDIFRANKPSTYSGIVQPFPSSSISFFRLTVYFASCNSVDLKDTSRKRRMIRVRFSIWGYN